MPKSSKSPAQAEDSQMKSSFKPHYPHSHIIQALLQWFPKLWIKVKTVTVTEDQDQKISEENIRFENCSVSLDECKTTLLEKKTRKYDKEILFIGFLCTHCHSASMDT